MTGLRSLDQPAPGLKELYCIENFLSHFLYLRNSATQKVHPYKEKSVTNLGNYGVRYRVTCLCVLVCVYVCACVCVVYVLAVVYS